MCITLTPAAEAFVGRMIRMSGGPSTSGLRLVVSPGGCSGFQSEFTVEIAPLPGDKAFDLNGVRVFLPEQSRQLLRGWTVDFEETPTRAGLAFRSPDGSSRCCGGSPTRISLECVKQHVKTMITGGKVTDGKIGC